MRVSTTASGTIGWLIKRADYLAMNAAKRWVTPYFIIQVQQHSCENACAFSWRVGFTTSRKVGNAVVRNRARRRLRELVRGNVPHIILPHHTMVFIGKTAAATVPFDKLVAALDDAARKLKVHV